MSKTIRVPDTWKPAEDGPAAPPFAFADLSGSPRAELMDQGMRCVGRDEHGRELYALPARHSVWARFS